MATNLNVNQCTYDEALQLVNHCIDLKLAVLVHGAPGLGKSTIPRDIVKQRNEDLVKSIIKVRKTKGKSIKDIEQSPRYIKEHWEVMDIRLGQYPVEDVAGLPVPIEVEKDGVKSYTTLRSLPDFLPRQGNGILLLDEINQANAIVLGAVFQLILDRKMTNGYNLPDGWSIVAACNDVEYNSDVTEFNSPINDRFVHISLKPDKKQWLEWARNNGIHANVIDFVSQASSEDLCDEQHMNDDIVFATPRSWARVSEFEKLFDEGKLSVGLLTTALTGIVGTSIATRYMMFNSGRRDGKVSLSVYKKLLLTPKNSDIETSVEPRKCLEYMVMAFRKYTVTDEQDELAVYNLTRWAYNKCGMLMEELENMWSRLYTVEEDGFVSDSAYIKENYPDAWAVVAPLF